MPTVLRALSERTSISAKTLEIAFRMRESGKSLESISDLCEVPMASLLKILPGDKTEEKSQDSQAQVSQSISVGPISDADISSTQPAKQELPRKRRHKLNSTSKTRIAKKEET
jgi:hypothetical protein